MFKKVTKTYTSVFHQKLKHCKQNKIVDDTIDFHPQWIPPVIWLFVDRVLAQKERQKIKPPQNDSNGKNSTAHGRTTSGIVVR